MPVHDGAPDDIVKGSTPTMTRNSIGERRIKVNHFLRADT